MTLQLLSVVSCQLTFWIRHFNFNQHLKQFICLHFLTFQYQFKCFMWYHTNWHLSSHQGSNFNIKLNFNWFQLLTVEWHISPFNSLYCSWHFKPFQCFNISQHFNSDPHDKPHEYRGNFYLFSVSQRKIYFLWFLKFTWNSPNNVYWFHSTTIWEYYSV